MTNSGVSRYFARKKRTSTVTNPGWTVTPLPTQGLGGHWLYVLAGRTEYFLPAKPGLVGVLINSDALVRASLGFYSQQMVD